LNLFHSALSFTYDTLSIKIFLTYDTPGIIMGQIEFTEPNLAEAKEAFHYGLTIEGEESRRDRRLGGDWSSNRPTIR
jgi:hypothetical protein